MARTGSQVRGARVLEDSLDPPALRQFLLELPKAELHLHLEGSVTPETLCQLDPAITRDEIHNQFHYTDFAGFLKAYIWVTQKLNSPQAYRLAVRHLIEQLRAQHVQYAEVTLSVGMILWKKQKFDAIFAELVAECRVHPDVSVFWIFDAIRQFGVEQAAPVFDLAKHYRMDGVVAIGIGGDEVRGPAEWFHDLYRKAKDADLRLTCHAGEVSNSESVWQALRIGSERIGHGIRSIDDPFLLDYLRGHDIPLEICPSSNLRTGVIPDLASHPIRRIFDAGVPVVLGTDDPALFATDLLNEYTICAEVFGFSRAELRQLAGNSLRYRFRPDR